MGDLDESWKKAIVEADILLLQREVPQEMNVLAAKYARTNNCKVLLDMGGADTPLDRELMENVDIVSPNETELNRILGDADGNLDDKVNQFMKNNPGMDLLFKRGSDGATYYTNKNTDYMDTEMAKDGELYDSVGRPAYSFSDYKDVELVDTTGAGDCFTAAYAVG